MTTYIYEQDLSTASVKRAPTFSRRNTLANIVAAEERKLLDHRVAAAITSAGDMTRRRAAEDSVSSLLRELRGLPRIDHSNRYQPTLWPLTDPLAPSPSYAGASLPFFPLASLHHFDNAFLAEIQSVQSAALSREISDRRPNYAACPSTMTYPLGHSDYPPSLPPLQQGKFPVILHQALLELERVGDTATAGFLPDGKSFAIRNQYLFEKLILSVFFPKMKGFASFQRQLNLYDFKRVGGAGIDRGSYRHEMFHRDLPSKACEMTRTKIKGGKPRRRQSSSTSSPNHSTSDNTGKE